MPQVRLLNFRLLVSMLGDLGVPSLRQSVSVVDF